MGVIAGKIFFTSACDMPNRASPSPRGSFGNASATPAASRSDPASMARPAATRQAESSRGAPGSGRMKQPLPDELGRLRAADDLEGRLGITDHACRRDIDRREGTHEADAAEVALDQV